MQKTRRPPFRSAVRAALRLRCPNCQQRSVLASWPNKIRPECPRCGLSFFREPGYYIGGMTIAYVLTILIVVPVFLMSLLLPDIKSISEDGRIALWLLFAVALSLLLMPYSYSLWLNLDFWFEPWTPQ
ncbi:MAG: DUF983 domain-containing protein, partial [Candidatus Acidiferrales bacterium]